MPKLSRLWLVGALWAAMAPSFADQPAAPTAPPTQAANGQSLFADVQRYESFGVHRFGTSGQQGALDWTGQRLKDAGFAIEEQHFALPRQYFLDKATLVAGGQTLDVVPQWWLPENAARFALSAPISAKGDATGQFIRLKIAYDQGAYLGPTQKSAIRDAMQRHPAAVLLTIDHPSGEIFTYNVAQDDAPWPVPVILVAPKDDAALAAAEQRGEAVSLSVTGHYAQQVQGRNLIGRLDRGKARTLVVSTPESSWFTSSCERGPGIAAFLATAAMAARSLPDMNLVFVATTGHEVGHGGMEYFIKDRAPQPKDVALWLHYGAALACRGAGDAPDNRATRVLAYSSSIQPYAEAAFRDVAATRLVRDKANVGELREILGAGYPHVLGMAALHPYFHTPVDQSNRTSPALLAPVVSAFLRAVQAVHDAK